MRVVLLVAGLIAATGHIAASEGKVDGWSFSGEARARLEFLDGQFRVTQSGSDQLLALRTLLRGRYDNGGFSLVGEFQDARAYLNDSGSFVSTSIVNSFALVNAHVGYRWFADGGALQHAVRAGRYTLDLGSRRFIERNRFRNTINSYTGIHWQSHWRDGRQLDLFWSIPVLKRPLSRDELLDNDYAQDEEDSDRQFWGVSYRHPGLPFNTEGELFLYGLDESLSAERATLNRDVLTAGLRWLKTPKPATFDFEFEAAVQAGERRATQPLAATRQDVNAEMLHVEAGYTFALAWRPRLSLKFDYASGDKPGGNFGRYENFFGTRRIDFGNTGIYGPFIRTNVIAPGIRLSFSNARTTGQVLLQHVKLAAAEDLWLAAGLLSPDGTAGDELGTTIDVAVRHWLVRDRLQMEAGGSIFAFGDYPESVPGGPAGARTLYGFLQLEFFF